MINLHLGNDHAGFELKEFLVQHLANQFKIIDHGVFSKESCDYPLIARATSNAVAEDNGFGILICGTGIGMSIAANRNPKIRAALCANEISACLARKHNNANILCLGARIIGPELALAIAKSFLQSDFEGGRHQRRLEQIQA